MDETSNSDSISSSSPDTVSGINKGMSGYWDGRFVITNIFLILMALLAAYLEYSLYPTIMVGHPFYETNITLHLSFFTYSYDATRCVFGVPTTVANCQAAGGTLQNIVGVPAFDFLQLFLAIVILANLYHVWTRSRKAA
jgi:hypothetical protein